MILRRWQASTALTLTIAMVTSTLTPLLWARTAAAAQSYRIAQVFPPSWRNDLPRTNPNSPNNLPNTWRNRAIVPAGTIIPTSYDKDKIVVTPTETNEVTLTVATDVRSLDGAVFIPAGSEIKGELRPADDGTQFVAEELIFENGVRYEFDATSEIITRRETITKRSNPEWLAGAAIGAVASSVLAEILGDIEIWHVLGGAGLGALASVLIRNREEVEVIVVDPATDLDLRLESDFAPNQGSAY
jgi:hypothetical protein